MNYPKKVVLITEDEPAMRKILVDKLAETGYETIQATNGEEGLSIALKEHPDLILLDVFMPKTDGMTMMNSLRQDGWGKTVPIILLTNVSPDNDAALKAIVTNQPAYYLMKAETKLADIVEKVNEIVPANSSTQR